jgi:ArsR family transcriptional regulator
MSLDARLKVLADPTRMKIVEFLLDPVASCCSRDDGVCGCDLEAFLGLSQPTVSHHMKALTAAGFVTAEKRGRWVYYALVPESFRELAAQLEAVAKTAEQARALQPILAPPA